MARYLFHTQTDTRITDDEGVELPTESEARAQAIITCGQMMKDAPDAFWGSRPWNVTVTNEAGLIMWEISMDGVSSAASGTV
jgi:hypothetical protein